jgi:hypothetical protein
MELQGTYTGIDLLTEAHTIAVPVGGTVFLLTIIATAVSPEKEVLDKEETDLPRTTFFKEEHPLKVDLGMPVNESPMVTSSIFLHTSNALFPILFTLSGRFILVRLLQLRKAKGKYF